MEMKNVRPEFEKWEKNKQEQLTCQISEDQVSFCIQNQNGQKLQVESATCCEREFDGDSSDFDLLFCCIP
jgi:hypothetical protein